MSTQTHDFTNPQWGRDLSWRVLSDNRLAIMGWGGGISTGDYLILRNGAGSTRYKVDEVGYYSDPHDQFWGVASFAPRVD